MKYLEQNDTYHTDVVKSETLVIECVRTHQKRDSGTVHCHKHYISCI